MVSANKVTATSTAPRAWILSRTSSDDSSDAGRGRESVPSQIEVCRNYAKQHGWMVVEKPADFADQDRSGRTYPSGEDADMMTAVDLATANYLAAHGMKEGKSRRQGLGKILAGINRGDILLVRDLTRLARPVPDSMLAPWLRQQLQAKGVRLVSIAEGEQDFGNLAQRLMSGISDTINDAAITKQVAQARASLHSKRDSGMLFCCPTCFGYRSIGKQKAEQIPDQIAIVRHIYKEILSSKSLLSICRQLNDDMVRTSKGKRWQVRTLRALLQRPAYAGLQRDTLGRLVASKVFTPCVPIEDWHRAQKVFQLFGKREDKRIHPLSGLVVCGHCNRKMTIYRSKAFDTCEEQWYYRCQGAHETGAQGCRDSLIRSTMVSRVEGVGGLVECLQPLCGIGIIESEKRKKLKSATQRQVDECRIELAIIGDRETAAFEEKQSGVLDDAQYQGIMERLRARRAETAKTLSIAEKEINEANSGRVDGFAIFLAQTYTDRQFGLPPLKYRELIRLTVAQVAVMRDSIRVRLVSGGEWSLPRLHIRNSRPLPLPCEVTHSGAMAKLHITYATRKANEQKRTVYEDDSIEIDLQGMPSPPLKPVDFRSRRPLPVACLNRKQTGDTPCG